MPNIVCFNILVVLVIMNKVKEAIKNHPITNFVYPSLIMSENITRLYE